MVLRNDRRRATLVVVDRSNLAETVRGIAEKLGATIDVVAYTSVLEVLGDKGPASAAGLIVAAQAAGPFLPDLLRWTDREHQDRVPGAVVGKDGDEEALAVVLGKEHVRWVDVTEVEARLTDWMPLALEVHDLRAYRAQHDAIAAQLREARTRIFVGEIENYNPPEGPPCGPPLPTSREEIQSLKEAKAQFERGLIRAAVRESGSLKDASAALGISYTSLWRRMR